MAPINKNPDEQKVMPSVPDDRPTGNTAPGPATLQQRPAGGLSEFSLSRPGDAIAFATTIQKLVTERKLFSPIKNKKTGEVKNFVKVEGWQFIGLSFGLIPIIDYCRKLDRPDNEVCYESKVNLINSLGQQRGGAIMTCSNKERGREWQDEYAIASMSETRAVSKAYRLALSWIMTIAGFEPTPAEEMDTPEEPVPLDIELSIKSTDKMADLDAIIAANKDLWTNKSFKKIVLDQRTKINPPKF